VASVQALAEVRTLGALGAVGLEGQRLAARGHELAPAAHDLLALATAKLAFAYHFARPQLDARTMPDADKYTLTRLVEHWGSDLRADSTRRRCSAAITLMRLRHADALDALLTAFDGDDARDVMCETEIVKLGLGRGEALGASILLRRRLLDAIGVLSANNQRVANWADGHLAKSGSLEPEVEAVLTDLRRRIFE
jgi:hypothetical protein